MFSPTAITEFFFKKVFHFFAIAILVTALISGAAVYFFSQKKPPAPITNSYQFEPNKLQIVHINLTEDILLEYKITPEASFDKGVIYRQELNLFVWDPNLKQYFYSVTIPPEEMFQQLNQIKGVEGHPISGEKE